MEFSELKIDPNCYFSNHMYGPTNVHKDENRVQHEMSFLQVEKHQYEMENLQKNVHACTLITPRKCS